MFRFPRLTPFVRILLGTLLASFILVVLSDNWAGGSLFHHLALSPSPFEPSVVYQALTYVFVAPPDGVFGVLVGLVFLWLVLAPFESAWGAKRTAQLVVATTVAAALPPVLLGALVPMSAPPLFGSGPLLIGGIAAFAFTLPPNGVVGFFGIPMRPAQLVGLILALSVLFFLVSRNVFELLADVGAVAGAWLFIRWMRRPRSPRPRPPARRQSGRQFTVIQGGNEDKPRYLN